MKLLLAFSFINFILSQKSVINERESKSSRQKAFEILFAVVTAINWVLKDFFFFDSMYLFACDGERDDEDNFYIEFSLNWIKFLPRQIFKLGLAN